MILYTCTVCNYVCIVQQTDKQISKNQVTAPSISSSLDTSVGSEPKLGTARFLLELMDKKARLGSPCISKSSAQITISCKKAWLSLACSMI